MKKVSKALPLAAAGLLALTAIPCAAFADVAMQDNDESNQATTTMTLQYIEDVDDTKAPEYEDNEDKVGPGTDIQVKYAVPVKVPMAFKSDGTLVCATGDSYKIDNQTIFDLKMSNVTVNPATGYMINGIGTSDTVANLTVQFTTDSSTYDAGNAIKPLGMKSLASVVNVPTADLKLAFGGTANKIANPADFATAQTIGSLTWTISPTGTVPAGGLA